MRRAVKRRGAGHLLSIIAFPSLVGHISRGIDEMIFGVQRGRAQVFACGPLTGGFDSR